MKSAKSPRLNSGRSKTYAQTYAQEFLLYSWKILEGRDMSGENRRDIVFFEAWLKSRRYSDRTIKIYTEAIKVFLNYLKERNTVKPA